MRRERIRIYGWKYFKWGMWEVAHIYMLRASQVADADLKSHWVHWVLKALWKSSTLTSDFWMIDCLFKSFNHFTACFTWLLRIENRKKIEYFISMFALWNSRILYKFDDSSKTYFGTLLFNCCLLTHYSIWLDIIIWEMHERANACDLSTTLPLRLKLLLCNRSMKVDSTASNLSRLQFCMISSLP